MLVADVIATAFRQNVPANGIYVSAETAGIIHAAGTHSHEHATEGFLPDIFNCVRVNTASTQSDSQALSEVRHKMCFGGWIARTKPTKIFIIKSVEVHGRSFIPVYFSLCCWLAFSEARWRSEGELAQGSASCLLSASPGWKRAFHFRNL